MNLHHVHDFIQASIPSWLIPLMEESWAELPSGYAASGLRTYLSGVGGM